MATTSNLSPADRDAAIERLVQARYSVDSALTDLDHLIHIPGLPRAEVTRLKDQRTKLVATSGALAGCRQRITEASQ